MAFVDWTEQALDSLARHDVWRMGQGWEPIAQEIYDAVEAYLGRQARKNRPISYRASLLGGGVNPLTRGWFS